MWRGRANMLLGNFLEAQNNFSQSARIDSNETLEDWIKENKPFADKVREYNVTVERKKQDRLIKQRKERIQKAKEEREAQEAAAGAEGMPNFGGAGFPPGAGGGMPGMEGLNDLFGDPEIMAAMQVRPRVCEYVCQRMYSACLRIRK